MLDNDLALRCSGVDYFVVAEIHRDMSLEEYKVADLCFAEGDLAEVFASAEIGITPDVHAVEAVCVEAESRAIDTVVGSSEEMSRIQLVSERYSFAVSTNAARSSSSESPLLSIVEMGATWFLWR